MKAYIMDNAYASVCFGEGEYLVKTLENLQEKNAFYRNRFDVFFKEMEWRTDQNCDDSEDRDEYDPRSVCIGIFSQGTLIGGARLIISTSWVETMMYRVFKADRMSSTEKDASEPVIEISRIFLQKEFRGMTLPSSNIPLPFLLYKAIFYWLYSNGFESAFLLVKRAYYRGLSVYFAVHKCDRFCCEFDGDSVLAEVIFWKSLFKISNQRPQLFQWFIRELMASDKMASSEISASGSCGSQLLSELANLAAAAKSQAAAATWIC